MRDQPAAGCRHYVYAVDSCLGYKQTTQVAAAQPGCAVPCRLLSACWWQAWVRVCRTLRDEAPRQLFVIDLV